MEVEDATQRVASELKAGQESLRELIEHAPVGVHWAAPDRTILWANQTELNLYGYQRDEFVGRSLDDFFLEPSALEWVFERLLERETVDNLEAQIRCKDGSIKEVMLSVNGFWQGNRFIHSSCFTREITDRKRVEAQIRKLNEELEQRVRTRTLALEQTTCELEAFSYTIAHDLRSPLRAMEGFAQALLEDYDGKLDDQGIDYLQRIVAAARREDKLIEDLLDYSQLKLAPVPLTFLPLEDVVEQVVRTLQDDLENRRATLRIDRPLPRILAHANTVEQILFHLLSNALKFTAPGVRPRIRIWSEERDQFVRLWIRDNGIGIAREHQQRIFNVFERLHGSDHYPGTGIGLAMVRKGMERLRGRTGVESELGKGSRFWIDFPAGSPPPRRDPG
jgi:PAS domain S-box-containing protein